VLTDVVGLKGDADAAAILDRIKAMASEKRKGQNSYGLLRVKETVGEKAWKDIGSAVIDDMGKTDKVGDFSFVKYADNWDNKLSADGKAALFTPEHIRALDDVAAVSRQYAKLEKHTNSSRSAVVGAILTAGSLVTLNPFLLAKQVAGATTVSMMLSKSQTAVPLTKWGKAVQAYGKNPSEQTLKAVTSAGRELRAAMERAGIPAENFEKAGLLGAATDEPEADNSDTGTPPVDGARKAPDGHWYVDDPQRPGKFLRVDY
jgi:hypothetical protein